MTTFLFFCNWQADQTARRVHPKGARRAHKAAQPPTAAYCGRLRSEPVRGPSVAGRGFPGSAAKPPVREYPGGPHFCGPPGVCGLVRAGEEEGCDLFHTQHLSKLAEDGGVVVVAVEDLSARAFGQDRDRKASVAVGSEGDAGFVVEDVGDGDGQGLIGAVEHVLGLLVLAGGGTVDALFVGGLELALLVLGEHQLVALLALGLQAKERFDVGQDGLKGGLLLFVGGDVVAVVLGEGDLLAVQQGQVGIIVGAGEADGEAAGLVVAGHQDQRLVGVLPGEVDGDLYRIGQGHGVVDGGGGVVGVAGPVDLTAFAHHEEALIVVQNLDALLHIIGQRPHGVGTVQLISHGAGIGQVLVDEDDGAAGDLLSLGLRGDHVIARFLSQVVQALLVFVGTGGLEQTAAGKILEAGVDQFQTDLIVAAAALLVGVEGGGGGVVEVDGGDHADLPAQLILQLFADGLIGYGAGLVHVDGTGIGLVAGGDGGGGGGGVGSKAVGIKGHRGTGGLKIHKIQIGRTVQLGAHVVVQAGLSVQVVLVGQGAQVIGGGLDLGIAHAVADEQEHVLGGLRLCGLGGSGGEGHGGGGREGAGLRVVGGAAAAGGQTAAQGQGRQRNGQGSVPIHSDFPPIQIRFFVLRTVPMIPEAERRALPGAGKEMKSCGKAR